MVLKANIPWLNIVPWMRLVPLSIIYKDSAVSHHHHIAHPHAAEPRHGRAQRGGLPPCSACSSEHRTELQGLTRLVQSRHGFSLIELTVSLGLGGFLLFGAYNYLNNVTRTYEHIQERSEDVVMNSQRLFSRQFLKIMNQSSLSLSFMTLFVPFTNTCTETGSITDGPCFFQLDETNQLQGDISTGPQLRKEIVLNKKTGKSKSGLNLFNDSILTFDSERAYDEIKVGHFNLPLPHPARFKREVIRAKNKRHFVGWSLKSVDTSKKQPFYVMAVGRQANRIFSANLIDGDQEASSNHYYVFNEDPLATTTEEQGKFAKIVSEYSNRFYLAFLASYPQLHYVTRMKQIISCSKSKLDFDNAEDIDKVKCKEIYDHTNDTTDSNESYRAPYSQNFKFIEDREACNTPDTPGKCLREFFEQFANIESPLSKANQTYAFKDRKHTNLFHFGFPNISLPLSPAASILWPSASSSGLINFVQFLNGFASSRASQVSISPETSESEASIQFQDRFIFLPIEFYKFYLEPGPTKAGKPTKQLVVEADQPWSQDIADGNEKSGDGDQEAGTVATSSRTFKQVLIKGLGKDDQIIFGRRLGSFQFSAFLFKHSQGDSPPAPATEGGDA